jgi:hypothetical protein
MLISSYNEYLVERVDLKIKEWSLYGKIWYLSTWAELYALGEPQNPPPFEVYDREYKKFEKPYHTLYYTSDIDRIQRWYQLKAQWLRVKGVRTLM